MITWGISAGFHDAALTVLKDNDILFASHSERFSKIKSDKNLDKQLVEYALRFGQPDQIAYYERPWVKRTRQLLYGDSRWKVNELSKVKKVLADVGIKQPIYTFNHHLSHAAAFQTSRFDKATVVVIDAIGEWDTVTIWTAEYKNGSPHYTKLWGQRYPHSIGLFYSAGTQLVGLKPNEEEYIMMGMAAYGRSQSSLLRVIKENIKSFNDCEFTTNLHTGFTRDIERKLVTNTNVMDVAATIQFLTESFIHAILMKAISYDWSDNLVYSGGVALNCSANKNIGFYFKNLWIMPNPGDAGSSLGCASLLADKRINWLDPFLGVNIPGEYPVQDIIDELLKNKICGVASGRAEFGPRALGNRSLLADPSVPDVRDLVNKIKHRQEFRPFGASILEEHKKDYFHALCIPSPYMQVIVNAQYGTKTLYPGIVHTDGSCRIQTVAKDSGTGLRSLLEKWFELTGCPMLLNTSLNIRGEPIVNDRADADRFQNLYGVKVCS